MNQTNKLQRDTINKFYTNKSVVAQCIKVINDNLDIHTNDIVIEPSAGNGAFISEIKQITKNYLFFDIEPEHPEISKQDFLTFDYKTIEKKSIHIVGNPPFIRTY